ncbi:MAG TPA: response regulator [Planctomycetota bacterium]|nr:response regulator [Planctomycetota bacterium]
MPDSPEPNIGARKILGRVLVVEDDEDINDVVTWTLVDQDLEVATAQDGAQALDMLSRSRFDMLILDLLMPRMGGLRLLEEVRGRGWDVPAIVITGYPDALDEPTLRRLRVCQVLKKPFRLERLANLIKDELRPPPCP